MIALEKISLEGFPDVKQTQRHLYNRTLESLRKYKTHVKRKELLESELLKNGYLGKLDIFNKTFIRALCGGSNRRSPQMDKNLKCKYVHRSQYFYMLGPFPMETLNTSPFVGLIFNFTSTTENEWFKNHVKVE